MSCRHDTHPKVRKSVKFDTMHYRVAYRKKLKVSECAATNVRCTKFYVKTVYGVFLHKS